MEPISIKLTVLFEDPFWIGLCERHEGRNYAVCRIVFGTEPKDYEVQAYILAHWYQLRFSPALAVEAAATRPMNPKRMQREARKQLSGGVGTKAQQALQAQREEARQSRDEHWRARRDEEEARRYELRQFKRREKHKGH